jgi:hypothetical protein
MVPVEWVSAYPYQQAETAAPHHADHQRPRRRLRRGARHRPRPDGAAAARRQSVSYRALDRAWWWSPMPSPTRGRGAAGAAAGLGIGVTVKLAADRFRHPQPLRGGRRPHAPASRSSSRLRRGGASRPRPLAPQGAAGVLRLPSRKRRPTANRAVAAYAARLCRAQMAVPCWARKSRGAEAMAEWVGAGRGELRGASRAAFSRSARVRCRACRRSAAEVARGEDLRWLGRRLAGGLEIL